MPNDVQFDMAEGPRLTYGPNGFIGTRVAQVTNVTGTTSTRLYRALFAVQQTTDGALGSFYPGLPVNIPLTSYDVRQPKDDSLPTILVTCTYDIPRDTTPLPRGVGESRLQISGTVEMASTQFYIEEVPFAEDVTDPFDVDKQMLTYLVEEDGTTVKSTCAHEVQFPKPMEMLELSRRETKEQFLANKNIAMGKINSKEIVALGSDGNPVPKHTLLCADVTGTSTDDINYDVRYLFQFKNDTWNVVVVYRDKETGLVPTEGLVLNKGIRRFRVIHEADFDLLQLWPTS
jgi:hypothetical protein